MNKEISLLFALLVLLFFSCAKDNNEIVLDDKTASLVQILEQELEPLSNNPLSWSDDELQFLDPIAEKSIIALGEATHGTAEFFKAKHRILKYLVENHDYKIFAIEADFGESVLINEAVQRGSVAEIEDLMKTKMHFWTWKTEEVKDLLEWMCEYNLDKPEKEKVQYMGIDCQYNTYHPGMVKEYLERLNPSFLSYAENILDEAQTATEDNFESHTAVTFITYLEKIDALKDSITTHEKELIAASSENEYKLHLRILKVIRQVSEVTFNRGNIPYVNYRDEYMAENTSWLFDHFDRKQIVLWAHNGHIANNPTWGSMGSHLHKDSTGDYATIGFLFSRGSLTAVGMDGENYTGLKEHKIDAAPKENSINAIMSYANTPVFLVKIADLQKYNEWNDIFNNDIQYFDIGAVFNNKPEDYYRVFNPSFFHYLIYFDKTTASILLKY